MKRAYWGSIAALLCVVCAWGWVYYYSEKPEELEGPSATNNPQLYFSPQDKKRLLDKQNAEELYEIERKQQQKHVLASLPLISQMKTQRVAQWSTPFIVFSLQFSPNGSFLAISGQESIGSNAYVEIRSTDEWKYWNTLPVGWPRHIIWSPDSRLLAIEHQGTEIWNVRKKLVQTTLYDVWGPFLFSADSSKLAAFGEDLQTKREPDSEAYHVPQIALNIYDVNGKILTSKSKLGLTSTNDYILTRRTDSLDGVNFARWLFVEGASNWDANRVSQTNPAIYIFRDTANSRPLFDVENHPSLPFATVEVAKTNGVFAISGNGWIYAISPQVFCARNHELLLRLSSLRTASSLAFSRDGRFLVTAENHRDYRTLEDGVKQEINRSQITVYRLSFSRK